jgi:acetoacetyl-CoA synthetase
VPGLAMKVEAFDETASRSSTSRGSWSARRPPSMPIYFWNDPDGKRYHSPISTSTRASGATGTTSRSPNRGGVVMHGRSDATLNPGGVRIGTAEIYRQVEQMEEIEDSVVVGQNWKNDVRVVLFVKMAPGPN